MQQLISHSSSELFQCGTCHVVSQCTSQNKAQPVTLPAGDQKPVSIKPKIFRIHICVYIYIFKTHKRVMENSNCLATAKVQNHFVIVWQKASNLSTVNTV